MPIDGEGPAPELSMGFLLKWIVLALLFLAAQYKLWQVGFEEFYMAVHLEPLHFKALFLILNIVLAGTLAANILEFFGRRKL